MSPLRSAVFLIAVAAVSYGQSGASLARLSGPSLGFAFDPATSAFRPILGIPGAARFAPPLDPGFPVSLAVVSAGQSFAIGINSADAQAYLFRFSANGVTARLLDGGGNPGMVVLSPRGGSAVLVDRSRAMIQIVTGLPESPSVGQAMRPSAVAGEIESIGVSDDGAALVSVASGDSSSLYLVSDGAAPQLVGSAGRVSAIAFLSGAGDALVADGGNNRLLLLRNRPAGTSLAAVAGQEAIADPVGVAASPDGRFAFVANAGSRSLVRLDLTGASASVSFPCHCAPAGLNRLAGYSVFQLTGLSAQPTWVFDGDAADPRILFIPAPVVAPVSQGSEQ